jgi:hypothetical protein
VPIATNPETGESVYLGNDGQWKPAPTAIHPESKQELIFDGSSWTPLKREQQGPQQPPPSRMDAFGRGFVQAGSFGFRDELAGLAAAGGAPPAEEQTADPALALFHLARGTYRRLTGDPSAEAAYNAEVERQRAETKRFEEQQPGASLAGQVVGAVAVPLPALRAATLPGRALQAAGIGAATGALSGAGEAEGGLAERGRGALTGGFIGGVAGGVAAPVLEGGIAAGRYFAGKPIELLRSTFRPDAQAERAIGRAYQQAVEADPVAARRLALGELGPGSPAVVADVLGQPGRNLSRSAANLSGQAADVIDQTVQPRGAAQSLRFSDWFRQFSNYPDVHSAQEAIDLAERTGNRANYGAAMKAGDFPIRSDFLERITSAPPVQRAMKAAAEAQQTRAVSEGYGGFRSPVTITADGQVVFNRGPGGVPTYPNLAFWDATRKQISDAARAAGRAGRNDEADVLGNLARSLNNELDTIVPSYQTARQGAAQFFGEENALKAGAKFVGQDFNMAQTRAVLNKMSDPERKLFQDGFVSRMLEELGRHERVMNRPQLVQRLFESPAAKERIELVLGPDRARELRAMLHVENIMQQAQLATRGQSTTVQQAIGAGLAGATGGYYGGYDPTSSGLLTALTVFSKNRLDQRVANRVATMLMSHDPKVVDRGVKMIANNERFMRVLQEADSAATRVAGTQAGRRAP